MLSNRKFNGKIIVWAIAIGATIMFYDLFNDSIDGYNLFVDYYNLFVDVINE